MPSDVILRPGGTRARRYELEFLPAALEIMETPPSPLGRAVALTITALVGVSIAWSCIGSVDIIATGEGHIVQLGRVKTIQAFEPSVVRKILVHEGDHVSAGQLLIELDPSSNQADAAKYGRELVLAELDAARLRALLSGLPDLTPPANADPALVAHARQQMREQADEQAGKIGDLDHQIGEKLGERQEANDTITGLKASLPMLQAHLDIRAQAVRIGFGNLLDFYDAQKDLVNQKSQIIVEHNKITEADQTLASLGHQREEAVNTYRKGLLTDLETAEGSLSDHRQDGSKAQRLATLDSVRAPVAGTVQQMAVHTAGGVVTPGAPMLVIVPDSGSLQVEAAVQADDAGFVHPGQDVALKIAAFDYTRYGLLHGTVQQVSAYTVSADAPDAPPTEAAELARQHGGQAPGTPAPPIYVATITLHETSVSTEQGVKPLTAGASVTAEIKTGRRSVIAYLLSPLTRVRHTALTER